MANEVISDEQIREIFSEYLNVRVVSIKHILDRGFSNNVKVVSTSSKRFVIRINSKKHLFRFQREQYCMEKIRQEGILVPKIVLVSLSGKYSFSIAEYLEGSEVIDRNFDCKKIWKILGGYASRINNIDIETVKRETNSLKYFEIGWVDRVVEDVNYIFNDNLINTEVLPDVNARKELKEYLLKCSKLNTKQGLCQFDITLENTLICNKDYKKLYLLDLEYVSISPVPHFQLSCVASHVGVNSDFMHSFLEGYGLDETYLKSIDEELVRLILLRKLRAICWARKKNEEKTAYYITKAIDLVDKWFKKELTYSSL